jgi:hypothetical protein
LLDKYEVSYETVRLRTLQEMEARAVDGSQGTFSIQYNNDLFCF